MLNVVISLFLLLKSAGAVPLLEAFTGPNTIGPPAAQIVSRALLRNARRGKTTHFRMSHKHKKSVKLMLHTSDLGS